MLKRRSKHFALLLVLAMLATMFVGVGTASAACNYSVLSTPTVLNNGDQSNLSTIQIDISQLEAKKHTLLITLPKDFEIGDTTAGKPGPVVTFVKNGGSNPLTGAGSLTASLVAAAADSNAGVIRMSDREFKVEFDTSALLSDYDVRLTVTLPDVVVPDSIDGDITATLTSLSGNFSSGSIVVGKAIGSGEVDAYINNTVTFSNNGTGNLDVEMNFKELTKDAIKVASPSIKVKLPKGLTWSNAGGGAPTIENVTTGLAVVDFSVNVSGSDARVLEINRTGTTVAKSIIRVKGTILVDEEEAVIGDVVANISGTTTVKPTTLTLGSYVNYDVTAEVKGDVPTVKPGRLAEEVADFEIVEGAKGSLLAGRSITLELPAGVKWAFDAAYTPDKTGSPTVGALQAVGTSGRKVKFNILTNPAATKGKIKFENVEVDLSPEFSGDLKVTIEGAGLDKTELVIAKSAAIATATATKPNVIIGLQNQDGGTIKLTEAVKESFKNNKDITLELPSGVEWSKAPTVKVTEGDLSLDEKNITRNKEFLTIPVKSQSTIASTIEISDIKYTIDRTVPEGAITVKLGGNAIAEVNDDDVTLAAGFPGRAYYAVPTSGIIFPGDTAVIEFDSAFTVTPASDIVKNEAAFVIGSTSYNLNGVEQTLDVAPYIKDSRTYMPIRYVGYALGITDANILWDGVKQTVTLMKGDKVVQLTIGSNVITINGAAVTMDVAPEISNSRTMLPISFVANAFGATASWDAATQTVSIK